MSDSHIDRAQRFARMHYEARQAANKSQEYMAFELGVAKKTVQNWEKGISHPDFYQSLEWFRVLRLNPMPYYLNYVYGENFKYDLSESDINDAFDTLTDNLPVDIKCAILFMFLGKHGSSPTSLIQLMLAHIHSPLKSRVLNASVIMHNFEMAEAQDELICRKNIMPDKEQLESAIKKGKDSAINKEYGYVNVEGADD